jgi:uncharacterized membrane protein YdbT with pleckstrin-like domain
MSYVDKSLVSNEQVTFRTHLHPIIFVWPVLAALICILLFLSGAYLAGESFLLLALLMGAIRYIHLKTSEFAVTNKRVIIKVGVLHRRTLELQLQKVETVAVNQGILGRIFGFGNILVTGTGGTKELFKNISGPMEFRRAVQTETL